ncbi:hypothetical protein OIU34_24300 [Pararhizobium sp. BT-229]|uniref:hypothetical protein n=1 Tax=Pararhizobium sp. BT-229 TaxID=2986923 RepID=UPI0021F7DDA6|nr:hypothetical protein [Pararhizobium sp. BT-229]MCV9965022.1 hypothetical protein [Pararhizobium sp. BT-229]
MSLFSGLTPSQIDLLNRPIYPDFTADEFDVDKVRLVGDTIDRFASPFVAFAINRTATWLEGEAKGLVIKRQVREPWNGDRNVEISREQTEEGVRKCTVTDRNTGMSWRLAWENVYKVPSVTVETKEADGSFRFIARAQVDRKNAVRNPGPAGDVTAYAKSDGFDALFALSQLMARAMPEDFRSDWKSGMQKEDFAQLGRVREILAADGGMPGPISRAYVSVVNSVALHAYAQWAFSKVDGLADAMKEKGVVWGEAMLEHGYDSTCVVPTTDGSVALFHDNSSTTAEERSCIMKFDRKDGQPSGISVYPMGQDESAAEIVQAFVERRAKPAFTFDLEHGVETFHVPKRGEEARNGFLLWFTKDVHFAVPNGRLCTDFSVFEPEDEDEDELVPLPPVPKV